jgi:hypothetical protein
MNEEMVKSLASLIDESLAELEELKKSDRFSASEIKIAGPGQGIDGKDPQGGLGKEDKEDEKDEEDEKKEKEEKGEVDKAEGQNRQADPNGGKHQMDKGEMVAGAADGSSQGSAPGVNRQADPNGGKHQMDKAEDKKEEKDEDKKKDKEEMKKSLDEQSTLLKSYVDAKFATFEGQLEKIAKLVQEIADAPVPSKSVSYKGITPLKKSEGEGETLTKSVVVEKLFELKKSGTRVDSVDIASAELANGPELAKIAHKYNIK